MATKKAFDIIAGGQSVIYIEYNDVNLRIGNIVFTIPIGFTGYVLIWVNGSLAFTNSYTPGSYSELVPGNYRVIEEIDPDDGSVYALMPPEIAWCVSWIGG